MSESQMDDILQAAQAQVQEILQHKVDALQALIAENKTTTEALMALRIQYAQQQSLAAQQTQQLNELKPLVDELESEVQGLENKQRQLNQNNRVDRREAGSRKKSDINIVEKRQRGDHGGKGKYHRHPDHHQDNHHANCD